MAHRTHQAVSPATAARAAPLPVAVRRHPFVSLVERGLRRCGVIKDEPANAPVPVVIGVSGGADSVALLLACVAISRRRHATSTRIVLVAVHVHHHLRASADEDANWVKTLCERMGVQCAVEHVTPAGHNGNLYANARRMRYDVLREAADRFGSEFVAVAHQAEDQLETMIAAICRGAGLDGLAGMPWSRPLAERVKLVRPLLAVRRAECEGFCKAAGIAWREDPANLDCTRTRARLRRDVLPVLEELWPDAPRRATAAADAIRSAAQLFDDELDKHFGAAQVTQWSRTTLRPLQPAIVAAGLRRAAMALSPAVAGRLSQRHLLQAAEFIRSAQRSPQVFHWPCRLRLSVTSQAITLDRDLPG